VSLNEQKDAATQELWRVAESGETDELDAILAQANINARNEHGVSALMRAAENGQVQMVRALLEDGADPNLTRNDNFTALTLAAFFGHTEVVRVLIEHGARTDVATRFGTSPHMWATARSFDEVARCLVEKPPAPAPVPSAKSVAPEPRVPTAPVVVKTLKNPPEIWDLVHEEPRRFNARSAFVSRVGSMKTSFALRMLALVIVVSVVGLAVLLLKDALPGSKADAEPRISANPAAPVTSVTVPASAEAPVDHAVAPIVSPSPPADVNEAVRPKTARRSRSLTRSDPVSGHVNAVGNIESTQITPATVAAPQSESRESSASATKDKVRAPLSPQLISPAKNSAPKAKVIQWP
jgi:ankyrin repeat protein